MPHWLIYHPPGTFEDEASKSALAKSITYHYNRDGAGMPAFYVVINFIQISPSDQYVGGELVQTWSSKPFIRLVVTHIHVKLPDDSKVYESQMERLGGLLKPHIEDKGYDWEIHIGETERRLWRINGLQPPDFRGEDEKVWVAENRAVRPEEMEAARERLGGKL